MNFLEFLKFGALGGVVVMFIILAKNINPSRRMQKEIVHLHWGLLGLAIFFGGATILAEMYLKTRNADVMALANAMDETLSLKERDGLIQELVGPTTDPQTVQRVRTRFLGYAGGLCGNVGQLMKLAGQDKAHQRCLDGLDH